MFRLSLRGAAPAAAAVAVAQLAVAVGLFAKGFTVSSSAAFAVVAGALSLSALQHTIMRCNTLQH